MADLVDMKGKRVGRILTSENAEIKTAAVSVNSLTISGKQVTLAVFRQLLIEPIVSWNPVKLNGVGWGHVNYLLDPIDLKNGSIHLVWQTGNELRRCIVNPSAKSFRVKKRTSYVAWQDPYHTRQNKVVEGWCCEVVTPWGSQVAIPSVQHIHASDSFFKSYHSASEMDAYRQELLLVEGEKKKYEDHCRSAMSNLVDDVDGQCDDYEAIVQPLFDLPQLFIAV